MSRIHIENDIYIQNDKEGSTIVRRSVAQSGKSKGTEVYAPLGYYINIQSAVKALIKMKIADSSATTLGEMIEDIKRIEVYIEQKLAV